MTPVLLMWIGGMTFMVFGVLTICNFARTGARVLNGTDDDNAFNSFLAGASRHLVFGMISSLGFLALLGGFVWFLIAKYH